MKDTTENRVPWCPDDTVRRYLDRVGALCPIVQCITNMVTVNDCANALLAIGASPTMAHHPQEMEDFAAFSDALVLNMGATEYLDSMLSAGKLACRLHKPVVIDPVGCAGSRFRRERCLELIENVHPACIRGNAAEICALAEHRDTGRGVDEPSRNAKDLSELKETAFLLSRGTDAIVIISGRTDIIVHGTREYEVHAGSSWMRKVTGAGCMLSSLLGAFLAAECSAESAFACCTWMAKSGEKAEHRMLASGGGSGTYHMFLLDALSMV